MNITLEVAASAALALFVFLLALYLMRRFGEGGSGGQPALPMPPKNPIGFCPPTA
jgi:hypothetical protein